MFGDKKYVFETQETRVVRRVKNFFLSLLSFFILYSIICLILLLVSKHENQITKENFFKTSPDIIVVFTGDSGRIPYAIKLAKEYKQSNILISGVHTQNNIDRILKDIELSSHINPNFLDLDYNAKNTYDNVIRTLQFLRERQEINDVLVISHDYHLLRIKAILNDKQRPNDHYNFYFSGVNSNLSSPRDLKIIYTEVFKFFRTLAYLALADID
jgi:uncharacterized SAM-binding protein YcdF (DUF218 family)